MHNDCQTIEKCQENRLKGAEFVRKGVHFFVTPCTIALGYPCLAVAFLSIALVLNGMALAFLISHDLIS